jgi:hypothetical protein
MSFTAVIIVSCQQQPPQNELVPCRPRVDFDSFFDTWQCLIRLPLLDQHIRVLAAG